MRLNNRLSVLLSTLVVLVALGAIVVRVTQDVETAPLAVPSPVSTDPLYREVDGVASPTISSITSPSPTCSNLTGGTGICYIEWNYLSVTALSGSYIVSMTLTIDNRIRAYHAGFFQSYMYIPAAMTAPGYQVTCGMAGSGGIADFGKTYNYVIRARETTGLTTANYGIVTCPADTIKLFVPLIQK